jgi:hypothetical protein
VAVPLYSALLFEAFPLAPGGVSAGGPGLGFRWVVRDIDCFSFGNFQRSMAQLAIQDTPGGAVILSIGPPFTTGGGLYSWRGRQVVEEESELILSTADDGWCVRMSGYVLSLP